MADKETILLDGRRHVIVLAVTDTDTLTDDVIVDVSTLTPVPDHLAIEEVWYDVQGYASITLEFDATTDDLALELSEGSGYLDFRDAPLVDPKSTGYTGDITVTTPTAAAAETFTIKLKCRKKY